MKDVQFEFKGTEIVGWRLAVDGDYINSQGAVLDSKTGDRFARVGLDYTIWENNAPGSWELINVTEVPLPAGGILLASGLFILAFRSRLPKSPG